MHLPDRLSADSPLATTVNQIIDYLRSLTPRNSATASVSHTPDGVFISAAPPKGGGTSVGHIRGEYISSGVYLTDDIVVVASGANAGTYACVQDNPGSANPPWAGGGFWIKLSGNFNALGQWM
jgi:hypothetical protein